MNFEHLLADRTGQMGVNVIREILKVVAQPGMVSLAGGGMFLWVEGPPGFDMEEMYWRAVKRNVAFVPGKYFYTSRDAGIETMRLNFTMTDEETINDSIKILSEVICNDIP